MWRLRFVREFTSNFLAGGAGIEVIICDRVGQLDCTAWSLMSMTTQSTNVRGGGGWKGEGMAWQLWFYLWMFVEFSAGGGFRHSDIETRRTKAIEPPGPSQQQTTIKQWTKRLGLKWPGGFVWAAVRTSHFYHVVIAKYHGEKSQQHGKCSEESESEP